MSSTARIAAISELRAAVARLREHEVSFLEGVRAIRSIGSDLIRDSTDPDIVIFTVVDSESDHLPNSNARAVSSRAWLEQSDREEKQLESFYGPRVSAACERLLQRFSGDEAKQVVRRGHQK